MVPGWASLEGPAECLRVRFQVEAEMLASEQRQEVVGERLTSPRAGSSSTLDCSVSWVEATKPVQRWVSRLGLLHCAQGRDRWTMAGCRWQEQDARAWPSEGMSAWQLDGRWHMKVEAEDDEIGRRSHGSDSRSH